MIQLSDLRKVIAIQREKIVHTESLSRELLNQLRIQDNFALIISGIRRCGKSTLLAQLIRQQSNGWLYMNFDTPRLYNFDFNDFRLFDEVNAENQSVQYLFFDEIQIVQHWEIYVRGKLDEGYRIVITGSNASMLSRELGTKLTGRYLSRELFPFSYQEFCRFRSLAPGKESVQAYMETGGFPQYVQTENPEILQSLVNDILYRDIAVRHGVRNEKPLLQLLVYLSANIGNLISANKLRTIIQVKSTTTVQEYLSYMESSYLIQLIPRFHHSFKTQLVNPRKIYFIDNGLQAAISPSFTQDLGRKFENMLFRELRLVSDEIYYFNENNKECDFVVCKQNKTVLLIQACIELTSDNLRREIEGLFDAMNYFHFNKGYIVTLGQSDKISEGLKTIEVIPMDQFIPLLAIN